MRTQQRDPDRIGTARHQGVVGGGVEIGTSELAYDVGAPIDTRIVNNTGDIVYVAHCNFRISLLIEQRDAGAWHPYLEVNAIACQDMGPGRQPCVTSR